MQESDKAIILVLVCFLVAFYATQNDVIWNYKGRWSNFDFEYHFKTIKMIHERGRYPLAYDHEYNVGFYPPLAHMIVRWAILAIQHPSLTEVGSQARPWTEMFTLNSFINALQVISIFLLARRISRSNLAGVSACLLIITHGFQTWPVMGPFPNLYGLVFIGFAIYFLFEGDLGGRWATPKYVLAGVFLICAGFSHPLSYVFSVAFTLVTLVGRLGHRAVLRQRPLLKPGDRALSILCLMAFIVPGASYYLRADPSGFVPHFKVNFLGVDEPFYKNPVTIILSDPWLWASFAVIGYSLWRRKPGSFLLGTWLLMPFILVEFHRLSPPYTLILGRYLTYGQPYFTQPQAILLGNGIAFLLQEATAEAGSPRKVSWLRLLLLGLIVVGTLSKLGELMVSPSTISTAASAQRLLQGAFDPPVISDIVSRLFYLGLALSVCIIIEFSALKHFTSLSSRTTNTARTSS